MSDPARALLRHMLATIAYRGGKATRLAPTTFGTFRAEGAMNTPVMLLAHIGDLIDWAHNWCRGDQKYQISEPLPWNQEVQRFHASLDRFDQFLTSGEPIGAELEPLFQAPIADILTHIGQISLLRRLAGDPVLGEAYRMAPITAGRVGPEQGPPGQEFKPDKGAIWRPKSA